MEGDRLYTLHELVWIVAPNREEAAQYVAMDGLFVGEEHCWDEDDTTAEDWLTLVHPNSEVALPDHEDGELYAITAREYAEGAPTGHVVDERFEDDE